MTLCKSDYSSEDDTRWMEEKEEDANYIALITEENDSNVKKALSNREFVHGRTYQSDMAFALFTMQSHHKDEGNTEVKGVPIETGPNRKSVISQIQCRDYERKFVRRISRVFKTNTYTNL